MSDVIMLKLGELVLKGQNRRRFEDKMIGKIKRILNRFGSGKIRSCQSTVYVEGLAEDVDYDELMTVLGRVFGIVALTRAKVISYDFEKMKDEAANALASKLRRANTFKVKAKRADKSYPYNSPQIEMLLGAHILERFSNLSVDVHNPEVTVYIEVREGNVYVHDTPVKGAGGLPSGMSGHGMLMLSGGIDSPAAGYCLAKRGMQISAVHFESPPYTSERARMKVEKLASKLAAYTGCVELYVVGFTKVQEEIRDKCREDLFTVIMRRFMLRIACNIASEIGAKAIITGESLGQVASQTLDAINCTDAVATMPVFRPFIGTDKQDIIDIAYKIDTYDISIEPYEDCCTVFTPRHPKTSPKISDIEAEEAKLDIEELVKSVTVEHVHID